MHEIQALQACTVGVVFIPGGILFFKNRDLGYKYLTNRMTVFHSTPLTYTLKGANLETGALEGVAIGINRHKICVANTHVLATPNLTYDVLCERLVQEAKTQQDIPGIIADFMRCHTVQGGRILVAAPQWGFLVEVLRDTYKIQVIESDFVMTNTFTLLPQVTEDSLIDEESSQTRLAVARELVGQVTSIGRLKSMLRSHIPEKGRLSICNHNPDGSGTESSHIIQIQGDYVAWSHVSGYPCEGDYQTIQLFSDCAGV